MTIAAEDLKNIDELVVQPTKSLSQKFPIGDGSGSAPKSITVEKLLRTRVTDTLTYPGDSNILDYANYEQIDLTVTNAGVDLQFINIPNNSTCYLTVTKSSSAVISFAPEGILGTNLGRQSGLTFLQYRILSTDGQPFVIQENISSTTSAATGSLSLSDMSCAEGTVTSLDHFTWTIISNICHLSAQFVIENGAATTDLFTVYFSNFTPSPAYYWNPIGIYINSIDADIRSTQAMMTNTSMLVGFDISLAASETMTVYINGSFKIE